ncbi:hypothetical protein [Arthrobacter sp. NPDC093139]|uniref:hypothetical protein n=1 Tax=Arthrobacter sp. NPDC093139 TaxID=3363945 RepID=UPI0038095024
MIFVLRMLFVARFLKVLFQLLLRVAAALAHGTYLLRRRCGVRVLVRAVIGRVWFLAHTGIVPPEVHIRKQWLQLVAGGLPCWHRSGGQDQAAIALMRRTVIRLAGIPGMTRLISSAVVGKSGAAL